MIYRVCVCVWTLSLLLPASLSSQVASAEDAVPSALVDFVRRPEPDFGWQVTNRTTLESGRLLEVRLTSQKWHDIVWEHAVEIFEPKRVEFPRHALLFVTGGSLPPRQPDARSLQLGMTLAELCGTRVILLHQVPNQPLLDNRREDDLITETWLRYLKTGDESWPLLFPMVKSAVKAMDAVQELATREFDQPVEHFIITGASKRGWTSWLTPVADTRIAGTAPVVIDVLNFRAQMKHQIASWGKYSDQIIDYSSKGLIVEGEESPREQHLRLMMDPYTYRQQLSLPKLIVNGTNDPYWVCDAMRLYWSDLSGPRYALQVPNAGHNLGDGIQLALSTVAAFTRHIASSRPLPQLEWSVSASGGNVHLTLTTSERPVGARLWSARSSDLDFRDERWTSEPLNELEAKFHGRVNKDNGTHVALYGEFQYAIDNIPYSLCTLIHRE